MGFNIGVPMTAFKYGINIAPPLDVATMINVLRGPKGESILNGGYNRSWLIVGRGDNYKTTLAREINSKAVSIYKDYEDVLYHEYDDEGSYSYDRSRHIGSKYPGFIDIMDGLAKAKYGADDLGTMTPDEYFNTFKALCEEKAKNKKSYITYEAYVYNGKPINLPQPNFYLLDSLSKFDSESTLDYLKKDASSGGDKNMIFTESGKYKTIFLRFLNSNLIKSNSFMIATGHLGNERDQGNKWQKKPSKVLELMIDGEKFKGIPPEATEMFFIIWYAHNATQLVTDGIQEYPSKYKSEAKEELKKVKYTIYRNKFGKKGNSFTLIFSQHDGFLRELTDFHYLREKKVGVVKDGNRFYCELRPEVKMFRKEVRDTIVEDKLLSKALEFTAYLEHLKDHRPELLDLFCSPKELYEDIKKLGYDWDILLNTRSYVTPNQYDKNLLPYLSIIDLLEVRKGIKKIWWYDDVKSGKWKIEGVNK